MPFGTADIIWTYVPFDYIDDILFTNNLIYCGLINRKHIVDMTLPL